MSTARFFVDAACAAGSEVVLDHDDARHARLVLRLRVGDPVVVVHAGDAWLATLSAVEPDSVRARVEGKSEEIGGELPVAITVMQAIAKGTKFDFVVEKAVELGARTIVPVRFERSYAEAGPSKLARWRRIARSAAQQARRRLLPVIAEPIDWPAALRTWRGAPPIVAYEGAPPGTFAAALAHLTDDLPLAIAIGPEGGLAASDVDAARAAGCALVSLGPTILRTETAALAMLAAVAAHKGWW